jgi:sulfur carrier protein
VEFLLNGEPHRCERALSVQELLERNDLAAKRVAVAVNADVVPRSRFAQVQIRDGDKVEILHAVGGG